MYMHNYTLFYVNYVNFYESPSIGKYSKRPSTSSEFSKLNLQVNDRSVAPILIDRIVVLLLRDPLYMVSYKKSSYMM